MQSIGDLSELEVERLGARGDGIAKYGGEPVFCPLPCPVTAFALGSASAAAEGGRAGSSNGSSSGPAVASRRAGISATVAAARCSTSMRLLTGPRSWGHSAPRSSECASIPIWCNRFGWYHRRGGGRGLG